MSNLKPCPLWKTLAKKYRKSLHSVADQIEVDMFVSNTMGEDWVIKRQATNIKELRAEVERLRGTIGTFLLARNAYNKIGSGVSLERYDKALDTLKTLAETETE